MYEFFRLAIHDCDVTIANVEYRDWLKYIEGQLLTNFFSMRQHNCEYTEKKLIFAFLG